MRNTTTFQAIDRLSTVRDSRWKARGQTDFSTGGFPHVLHARRTNIGRISQRILLMYLIFPFKRRPGADFAVSTSFLRFSPLRFGRAAKEISGLSVTRISGEKFATSSVRLPRGRNGDSVRSNYYRYYYTLYRSQK